MTIDEQTEKQAPGSRVWMAIIPLAIFAALALLFWRGLGAGDPSKLPSALIGKSAPDVALPALANLSGPAGAVPGLDPAAFKGAVTIVNVWASWCVPCRQEHPVILGLAQDPRLNVVGINYKDKNDAALAFLGELGNPFRAIGVDPKGAAAIDWGVYGIPESFLVGPDGTILFKQVGPFTDDAVRNQLLPKIEEALGAKKS